MSTWRCTPILSDLIRLTVIGSSDRVALDVAIMNKAFAPEKLMSLRRWKAAIDSLKPPLRDMFLLLFFSILEPCSITSKDGHFLRLVPNKKTMLPRDAMESVSNRLRILGVCIRRLLDTLFFIGECAGESA